MPKVLNIRDLPGHKIPEGAVYVGRAALRCRLAASRWGNKYRMGPMNVNADTSLRYYRSWVDQKLRLDPHFLDPLIGHDLVCWCAPGPCHADILLELANKEVSDA